MREVSVEQMIEMDKVTPVDVRSPGEYQDFHIPGAINIPLFTNEERAEIGTIYKQQGSDTAKWHAMEIVSPKIPAMLGEIRDLQTHGEHPVVYCWRGGMRSKAIATFLSFSGLSVPRLTGGYRAYRHFILERIPALIPPKAITLHGMTGVGKTEILLELEKRGFPIIDLEGLAAHRGSIFGTFGLDEGNSQKTFDALLYNTLSSLKDAPYFIVEAESKRIGNVVQPDELLNTKLKGINIQLSASLESRIARIYTEYVLPYMEENWFQVKVLERLSIISKRIKEKEIVDRLLAAARTEDYKTVISILLEDYYDPRYSYKQLDYEGPFFYLDNAENVEKTVDNIIRIIQEASVKVEKFNEPL